MTATISSIAAGSAHGECAGGPRRACRATVADLRGMLAAPGDSDQAAFERAGYVAAMRAANAGV